MWKKAWKNSLSFFGWNIRTFAVPLFLWFLGAFIYYQWQGVDAVLEEIAVAISFALIPIAVFLVGLFIFNLIRAPVYIKWEREREPQLIVEDDTSVCNHKLGYNWRLRIKNNGVNVAENCRGQLIAFAVETPDPRWGYQRWPVNEFFSWADGSVSTSMKSKQTMELEILYGGGYRQYLYLAYAREVAFRGEYALKSLEGNILLVFSISCNGKLPIYVVCLFYKHCDSFKNLKVKAITTECPDITFYQQLNSHKEGSQT